jgi:hypothetical protein
MSVRAYEPKVGYEDVQIEALVPIREVLQEDGTVEVDRKPGETFVVGTEETPWPYATEHPGEQAFLDDHPLIKRVAAEEAQSADPKSRKAQEKAGGASEAGQDQKEGDQ